MKVSEMAFNKNAGNGKFFSRYGRFSSFSRSNFATQFNI